MLPTSEILRRCIILTGPTGSGKTALAIELAESIGGEIIAADSMTLYRGMDIGTAKPTLAERQRIPHHLIDVLDPGESASVAWWMKEAERRIQEILSRGRRPLIVGGTPFYLKAMLFGLFESPPADLELRQRLEADAEREGPEALHARLREVDAVTAQRLHVNDVRRVVRALEVFEMTGQPISALQQQWEKPSAAHDLTVFCLDIPRDELYERIDRRVDAMMSAGWLDEVQRLRDAPLSRQAACALGYAELNRVLDGELTLTDAVALIKLRSRQFAKRQLTWFRNWPGLQWIRPELTMLLAGLTID